jgi:TetR/AcrR family fatty acid metabolism transcriptional regulator
LTLVSPRGSHPFVQETESPFSETTKPKRPRNGREKPAVDKREKILRAAIRVFAKKGFYATRVTEIAKAAGVADGTIYLYFKNKDDLLISIFEDRITKLIDVLKVEIGSTDDVSEKLRRIIALQLGSLDGHRSLAEVVTVNLRQSSRLLKQYAAPLFTQYLEVVAGVIAEGQRDGVLRDDVHPFVVARSLWGALDGLTFTWALGGEGMGSLKKAGDQFAATFLDGIRHPGRLEP